jgi:hypothetical protein
MFIKVTKENLDYINKARKKYNEDYKNPTTFEYNIDIDKTDNNPLRSCYANENNNFISFEEFKKLYPLEEINKPIELW